MKETNQLRKLMEAIDSQLNEDWGSSDWYPIMKSMDEAIAQYGLSPETIQDAANHAADFYYDSMGYDNADDAQDAIIQHWKRTSETGQQLMRMFAPVKESFNEEVGTVADYDLNVEVDAEGNEYVTLTVLGTDQEVVVMSSDNWIQLANKYIRIHRTR